jgi:hypothetical protein
MRPLDWPGKLEEIHLFICHISFMKSIPQLPGSDPADEIMIWDLIDLILSTKQNTPNELLSA